MRRVLGSVRSAPSRGAHLANHDTLVAAMTLAAALLGGALITGCGAIVPEDASASMRSDNGEAENDLDPDSADQAPYPAPGATAEGPLTWMASEEAALARSKQERRPVLALFSTEWCADCKRLSAETFGDPRVTTEAGRFVAFRIDATNDEDPQVSAALQKYAVINVPTLILLDSAGHEQRRFNHFVRPDKLLAEFENVR